MNKVEQQQESWHPLGDQHDLSRKQLAKYLNRVGRGLSCRLDVPVLVMDDVKWAAKIFEDLSKELAGLAFNDGRTEILRILAARYAMESAKRELHLRTDRKETVKLSRKEAERGNY